MDYRFRDQDSLRAQPSIREAQRKWRVVIAEDEALPAELLKRTIMRLGHNVVAARKMG